MKKLTIGADRSRLGEVLSFVEDFLGQHDCPPKTLMQIDIAVEEIFVNIASYAYAGDVGETVISVDVTDDPASAVIEFSDSGLPFDPLKKPDPDVTLSADERQIGGLGIFMVKKTMDEVSYKYENGQNVLTIRKKF